MENNILIINTANDELYIALKLKSKLFSKSISSNLKHNELMLTKIDEILREAKIELKDVDALGVVVGPGSFTGVRVGISTIKAFRDVLNIEARGINNLELLYNLAVKQNSECEVVAIAGSRDSYFVGRKLFDKLYIYERNLSLNELKNIAKDSPVGMYKTDENLNSFKVEIEPNILMETFEQSADRTLVPVYYQLSQAESEKFKRASVEIREVDSSDLETIAKIESESLSTNIISYNQFKEMFESDNHKIFVVLLNSEITGFIALEITDEINIVSVAIKKEFRNLGLATKLIDHTKIFAKNKGINDLSLEVSVNNPTAYLLYEKCGFKLRRTRKNYYLDGADCLEMSLKI